jgi:hypothetical protein
MRKNHLSNKEIQEFREMDSAQIGSLFFQKGVSTGAKLFHQLLESFEIANRVALAAWGYCKAIGNQDEYNAKEEYSSMEKALSEYSPGNFHPHVSDLQFAAEYFEQMYNEVCTKTALVDAQEVIFEYGARLHEMLASKGGPLQKPDVQQVANGMERIARDLFPCIEHNGVTHIEREDLTPLCGTAVVGGKRIMAPPTCVYCIRTSGVFQ